MKNLLFIILLFTSNYIFAQSTTITPGAILPQMTTAQRTGLANPVNGMMVYDLGTSSYWYYQNTAWSELPKAGSTTNYWQLDGLNGNEIKNSNSGGFWSANPIGLTTSSNSTSNPPTVPISGNGTRMMWIPSRSAFRVGTVANGEKSWDADSVGLFSTAFGFNSKAIGGNSSAFGFHTIASGYSSTAMGEFTNALGESTTAMGLNSRASGEAATAMGYGSNASGDYSTAMGFYSSATKDNAVALGYLTIASKFSAFASGSETIASGANSTATGNITVASGDISTTMGDRTQAKAFASLSIGRLNDISDNPTNNIGNDDRIFQIGNGYQSPGGIIRSNAITILRNAKTGINTATPDAMLHVNGFTKLGDDAPKIKTKKITGTTSTNSTGTTGLSVSISHGIGDADKILSIDVMVENASGQWTHGWYPQPNYEFGYYLTNATVVIVNTAGNSSVIAGRPVRVLIVYEE